MTTLAGSSLPLHPPPHFLSGVVNLMFDTIEFLLVLIETLKLDRICFSKTDSAKTLQTGSRASFSPLTACELTAASVQLVP